MVPISRSLLLAVTLSFSAAALAGPEDDALRMTRQLALPPGVSTPGTCVSYKEGGLGWLARDPVFWFSGSVEKAALVDRAQLPGCNGGATSVPPTTRRGLVAALQADDCNSRSGQELPRVTVRVRDWETPWGKEFELKGRLYRGTYLDTKLAADVTIDVPPELLVPCDH